MRDGGPAFPAQHYDLAEGEHGMTLRDYFAAKAMQGDWAAGNADDNLTEAADRYYKMADAMLWARSN